MKQAHTGARKKRRLFPMLAVLTALVLLSFTAVTGARYAMRQTHSGLADAREFYFTSDLLGEGDDVPEYHVDPQAAFKVALYNYADDQRATSVNIPFEVTVENGTASPSSGTLEAPNGVSGQITITPDPDKSGAPITVTVRSTSPYVKTLKATFLPGQGNSYTLENSGADNMAAVLTVTCTEDIGEITLLLPDGLIPDATDSRIVKTASGYTFRASGKGVYSLVLLKQQEPTPAAAEGSFIREIDLRTGA